MEKGNSRKFYSSVVGKKVPNWECLFVNREKELFLSVFVDGIKLAGKKQHVSPTLRGHVTAWDVFA